MATKTERKSGDDTTRIFQDVKSRASLVDYIAHCTSQTPRRVGSVQRFNPCPFCGHKDCFTVFGDGFDAYKCHSCGRGGDIFNFCEEKKAISKGEALREVAQFAGVQLPDRQAATADGKPKENTLQRILEAAVAHYRKVLAERADLLEWVKAPKPAGRGHRDRTIERMEIGAADGKLEAALKAQGFTFDQIKTSGLVVERKGQPGEWRDFFTPGLIIFPHRLATGEVAHFTIKDPRRKVDYQLRAENRLDGFAWGNQRAIRSDVVILCEGENDGASFCDADVHNYLMSLGSLSDEQLRWLETHAHGKTFVLWFDYDLKPGPQGQPPAGIRYTRKVYQRILRARSAQVLVASALMEPGEDPDDWIQKDIEGAPRRIQAVIKKAHNPLIWELKVMPADVRADADAALRHLTEIEFFEYLGMLPELGRDAVIVELQKFGFSRDSVLNSIKDGYDLREQLTSIADSFEGSTRNDGYKRVISTAVWDYFKQHGKFFVSGEKLHLFYHHAIYQIGDNTPFKALMHREAGINYKQDVAGFVWEELKALCYTRGDRLTEFGWISLFDDKGDQTLYLNLKDPANRIMKVARGEVDIAENGTNVHNVLLAESSQMKPFRYDPEANVPGALRDLKALVLDSLSCETAQRYLVLAWALSAYLLPFCETRALMKMEGMSGSGKTSAAKLLSLLIYGDNMVGRSSTASDYSMASTEPLIIKDNMETDDINRNALNFLLLAATGATNIKRSQGTESGVVTEKINCLVAITAIEPFAKPELISRTFIIDFSKRWQRNDFVETEAVMNLLAKRDDIMSAWLQVLAETVLPSLDERGEIIKYIKKQHKDYAKERVTEFTALLVLITKALLKHMPLSEELRLEAGDRSHEYVLLDRWIQYQNEHSRMTEQGTNAVLQLLDGLRRVFLIDYARREPEAVNDQDRHTDKLWCDLMGVNVYRQILTDLSGAPTGHQLYWFEASTADLLAMLNRYGREYGVKVPFSNAKQLGVRISNEMVTLNQAGWRAAQARVIHGNRISRWQWSDAEDTPDVPESAVKTAPKAQLF
jgi:DNA primase